MKKLFLSLAAVVSLTCTAAIVKTNIVAPAQVEVSQYGWVTIRETVSITTFMGHMKTVTKAGPLQKDEEGNLRVKFSGNWYSVSYSNRDDFNYMIYVGGKPRYFN